MLKNTEIHKASRATIRNWLRDAWGYKGRKRHIHHIDGNRENNHILNLIPLTEREHREIHGMFLKNHPMRTNRHALLKHVNAFRKYGQSSNKYFDFIYKQSDKYMRIEKRRLKHNTAATRG